LWQSCTGKHAAARTRPALHTLLRDTLEDRLGMTIEQGAGHFSLIKHTSLLAMAMLFFAWLWMATADWQTLLAHGGEAG